MKNKEQLAIIVPFVVILVGTLLTEKYFEEFEHAVLGGLLLGIFTLLLELIYLVRAHHAESRKEYLKSFEKFCDLLRLDNGFYDNEWLHEILRRIVIVHEHTASHPYFLQLAQKQISHGLNNAEELMTGKHIELSGWAKEINRQQALNEIILHSREYVYAVTSYDPKYWDKFWFQNTAREYTKNNVKAAKRGVIIKRIFLLPNEILSGEDVENSNKLAIIIKPMLEIENMNIFLIPVEELPASLEKYQKTNFLVSDNLFASLTKDFSNKDDTEGYLSVRETIVLRKLLDLFDKLLITSKPANHFSFLKE